MQCLDACPWQLQYEKQVKERQEQEACKLALDLAQATQEEKLKEQTKLEAQMQAQKLEKELEASNVFPSSISRFRGFKVSY